MKPMTAPAVAPITCIGPLIDGVMIETANTAVLMKYVTCNWLIRKWMSVRKVQRTLQMKAS